MRQILLLAMAVGVFHGDLGAQAAPTREPLSGWLYFKEIPAPRPPAGLTDFVLDRETLDQARADQEDLRLYDSAGREVPYVLRVRRDVATTNAFPARDFNRSVDGGVAQVSLDLGGRSEPHNQVEIDTAGNNFRRLVDVGGSADDARWSTLASAAIIFRFAAGGHSVEQLAVDYPVSQYRYLRIRVARDPETDRAAPELLGVRVRRSIHLAGEMMSTVGNMEPRDADRANARPASLWRVDLGGRIPIQQVLLNLGTEGVFSRPFRLEAVDDPAAPVLLASGELMRRESGTGQLKVGFEERWARRLRLTVIDDRNPPLPIFGLTAEGAARQVVFDGASAAPGVMRLYYGSARALAPRYDLAARVPAESGPMATRLMLGPQRDNPAYRPEPRPFSERSPWLVYVVLAVAGIVLAAILASLARASAVRAAADQPSDPAGS
jgi:Protein of unknown function (DUF3999)